MKYFYMYKDKKLYFKASYEKMIKPTLIKVFKKNDIDINNHLKELGFNLKQCNICKTHSNPHMKWVLNITENEVKINSIEWGKNTGSYDKNYCYGENELCPGLKMNSNSVEFISLTLDLTKEEALKYIHKNNKSPFYKENHENEEDYKNSQSRGYDTFIDRYGEKDGESKYQMFISKLKYSLSKERYLNEFGETEGYNIWKELNKRKAITLSNLQSKYGEIDGEKRWINWKNICSKSNFEVLEKYGIEEGLRKIETKRLKKHQSMIENGKEIIPRSFKYEYMIYANLISEETQYQLLLYGTYKFGNDWKERKKKENLHIDHKLSIKCAFLSGVHYSIVGNIENLDLIDAKENMSKKDKSNISVEELIENIKNSKYGEHLYRK